MITFLTANWYWILFVGAFFFMHAGHGGHGGGCGGGHGSQHGHGNQEHNADGAHGNPHEHVVDLQKSGPARTPATSAKTAADRVAQTAPGSAAAQNSLGEDLAAGEHRGC